MCVHLRHALQQHAIHFCSELDRRVDLDVLRLQQSRPLQADHTKLCAGSDRPDAQHGQAANSPNTPPSALTGGIETAGDAGRSIRPHAFDVASAYRTHGIA